ncbi:EbsA family protein [Chitinophaga sp. G-6-1-13]|uniref:EbsA family protein n=1 Tax=Chitinophaga fulva TaxID=2728842 RepID=A0A848GSE9_9BACT|nr:EbsA family protein [Chitinophaga fulva]NML39560.1 EbsA family protein [Chitinophaga fulva]
MEQPKRFTREGNVYKMKPQYGFSIIAIALALGLAYLGFHIKSPAVVWIFLALAVIFILSAFTKSLVVDMDKKVINAKMALIKPAYTIPIEDIQHFELYSLRTNFITTNTTLNVYFLKDGKEKSASLAQGITKRAMQNILNDIEEIIGADEYSR